MKLQMDLSSLSAATAANCRPGSVVVSVGTDETLRLFVVVAGGDVVGRNFLLELDGQLPCHAYSTNNINNLIKAGTMESAKVVLDGADVATSDNYDRGHLVVGEDEAYLGVTFSWVGSQEFTFVNLRTWEMSRSVGRAVTRSIRKWAVLLNLGEKEPYRIDISTA